MFCDTVMPPTPKEALQHRPLCLSAQTDKHSLQLPRIPDSDQLQTLQSMTFYPKTIKQVG